MQQEATRAPLNRGNGSLPAMADSDLSECSSRSSSVRFNNKVRVRTHKVTLGDNPSVSAGPPLSLDWAYSSGQVDLEEYERTRSKSKPIRISEEDREDWLQLQGYSRESIKRVSNEIELIKESRRKAAGKDDQREQKSKQEPSALGNVTALTSSHRKTKSSSDLDAYLTMATTSLRTNRLEQRKAACNAYLAASEKKTRRPSFLGRFHHGK